MASNLLANYIRPFFLFFFFVSNSHGLQPNSDGLRPTCDGLQPQSFFEVVSVTSLGEHHEHQGHLGSRTSDEYEKQGAPVGEGTYGTVWKAPLARWGRLFLLFFFFLSLCVCVRVCSVHTTGLSNCASPRIRGGRKEHT